MSIRWVTSLLGLLLTVTIMVTAGLSWNVYSSFTKMVEADVQYLNLMQVSRELLQSSYDLTRKAREYVNTGDEAGVLRHPCAAVRKGAPEELPCTGRDDQPSVSAGALWSQPGRHGVFGDRPASFR